MEALLYQFVESNKKYINFEDFKTRGVFLLMHGMNLFILVVSTWRLLMNHQYFTMMLNCNYCLTLDRAQSLISKIYLQTINYKLRQSESL